MTKMTAMNHPPPQLDQLLALKNQLSAQIKADFDHKKFDLLIAVSDAALNTLLDEMKQMLASAKDASCTAKDMD